MTDDLTRAALAEAEARGARVMKAACLVEARATVPTRLLVPGAGSDGRAVFSDMERPRTAEEIAEAIEALALGAAVAIQRPDPRPRCADCHQLISEDSRTGHLPWCPFDGYPTFPRAS